MENLRAFLVLGFKRTKPLIPECAKLPVKNKTMNVANVGENVIVDAESFMAIQTHALVKNALNMQ